MLQILMGVEKPVKKQIWVLHPSWRDWGSVSSLPWGAGSLTACPIPVLLHVQLVSQQEHGAAALAAPRVQGEHLQVALAALEALPVVDAVDNKEGAGPAQVALAVPGAILGVREVAELQSSRGPAMVQLVITPRNALPGQQCPSPSRAQAAGPPTPLRSRCPLQEEGWLYEDGLAHPVSFKAKQSLGHRGKNSALMRSILHQCLPPYSFLRQHYFGGLVVMLLGKPG